MQILSIVILNILLIMSMPVFAGDDKVADTPITNRWQLLSDDLDDYDDNETVMDPLEGINRAVFTFNDRFYFWILRPTARGYNYFTPEFIRKGLRNFFYNIMFPVRFAGSLFQGKFNRTFQETCRFTVNSAVGLGGFMTPSNHYQWLNPPKEDIGQAMATWGIGDGPYLVLPFIGGSTLRDTIGFIADQALYPFAYLDPFWLYMPIESFQYFNDWSFHLEAYPELKKTSMDPYSSVKDAYMQYRRKMINE